MAAPTPYDRQYSFATWQSQHPSDPLPGDELDGELNAVRATTDEIISNLGLIQRADGELANASVGLEQLKPELSVGVAPAVAWAADTDYAVDDTVFYLLVLYRCIEAHTSTSSFDGSKFTELADLSSLSIPSGAVTADKLAANAATTAKILDGAVTPAKLSGFPGSCLFGRYSSTAGGLQTIVLGSGLSFDGNTLTVSAPAPADGSITTAKLANAAVTSAKLGSGAAVANIGYTPMNKAGDTVSGEITRNTKGVYLYHGDSALASGKITVSTSSPSGGADGDIWIQVAA